MLRTRVAVVTFGLWLAACVSAAPVVSAPEAAKGGGPCSNGTEATCPEGADWDGVHCVRKLVVLQVTCPPGSHWDGSHCVADVAGASSSGGASASRPPQRQATDRVCTVALRSLMNVHAPEQHIRVHLAAIGCPTWMARTGLDASTN